MPERGRKKMKPNSVDGGVARCIKKKLLHNGLNGQRPWDKDAEEL